MSETRARRRIQSEHTIAQRQKATPSRYAEDKIESYKDDGWAPPYRSILMGILSLRLFSGMFNTITDCDEVFNYWEPTHYILYGSGLQTWEYSPEYGLRSYFFLLPYVIIGKLSSILYDDKVRIFFCIRFAMAVASSFFEVHFVKSVESRFGSRVALYLMTILILSPGMFISSTAFLPSSYSMWAMTFSMACWFKRRLFRSVTLLCISVIVGWPFSGLVAVPMIYHILWSRDAKYYVVSGCFITFITSGLVFLVDSLYYQDAIFPPLNILMYNVRPSGGSDLYGTEPWYFYLVNCFLNFNLAFVFALFSLPFSYIRDYMAHTTIKHETYLEQLPMYIWIGFMSIIPHKEERFIFVVYPLICLNGAIGLKSGLDILDGLFHGKPYIIRSKLPRKSFSGFLGFLAVIVMSVLSISRIASITTNYSAPIQLYQELGNLKDNRENVNVCVGKEWYRFPSSFFLPQNMQIRFLKSEFSGLLPKPFLPENGTWQYQSGFNNLNDGSTNQYVNEEDCHYIVDLDLENQTEKHYMQDSKWTIISYQRFLDANKSPNRLARAFFIPWLSPTENKFAPYVLLKKISPLAYYEQQSQKKHT